MYRFTIITLLLTTLSCFIAKADAKQLTVYSWVDEKGIAHFSYVEPSHKSGVRSFELKDHTSFGAEKRKLELGSDTTSDNADPLISRKKEYCENAKHNLSVLENYDQVSQVDENGQKVTISGSAKDKYKKQAQQRIKAFCE
ncbi:hypothetical protein [Pseudoalteromonas sp. MMG024]|uniref:hypothetical protein n=1 Tax=Pseudoalteromonas sp. MMG024 TaxID=2909980 RepID=UPI001F32C02C|nr:hypothetical protein [Pseudoalteromonas sp. MMG024]MCF6457122.1 hypothetical protein [Pseudoalteromonas sp. MMG024]